MILHRSHSALLIVLLSAGYAAAQAPPGKPPAPAAPAAPASTDPAQTTATYGDGVLRCVRTGANGSDGSA